MRYLVVAALLLVACGNKKKQKRTGNAAPVVVVPAPVFDGGTPGTATTEVEPNDSIDIATAITVGGTARGEIGSETDADYYRIEVGQAGALSVATNLVDIDLTVDIEDGTGAVLAKSDRGANRVREGVPNLGVTPGKYIVVVKKKPPPPPKKTKKKAPAPTPAPFTPVAYEITTSLATPPANAEREPDDDRGTAIDLIPGDPVQGFIGWTGDIDLWKLSVEVLSAKNVIDIEVGAVEGVALSMELADGVGQTLLTRKAPKGSPLVVKHVLPVVASGAPPFHYVTIKGDKSNPDTHYTLRVTPKNLEPDMEVEPNDSLEKAMPFDPERTKVDGMWTAGDVDYFAVAPDANPRTLDIVLEPEADLSLDIFVDGKLIAKSETAGKDATEKLLAAAVPPNAKAVVRVRPAKDSATGEGPYVLSIREGTATPP